MFNYLRLQPIMIKYFSHPMHKEIKAAVEKMNADSQELFELKWVQIKAAGNSLSLNWYFYYQFSIVYQWVFLKLLGLGGRNDVVSAVSARYLLILSQLPPEANKLSDPSSISSYFYTTSMNFYSNFFSFYFCRWEYSSSLETLPSILFIFSAIFPKTFSILLKRSPIFSCIFIIYFKISPVYDSCPLVRINSFLGIWAETEDFWIVSWPLVCNFFSLLAILGLPLMS